MSRSGSQRTSKQNNWRRSFKACLNCRARKVKCDLGPLDAPNDPPCRRCRREGKVCEFSEASKRTLRDKSMNLINSETNDDSDGWRTAIVGMINGNRGTPNNAHNISSSGLKWKFDTNSMQSALVFLAKAAGSVAKQDDSMTQLDRQAMSSASSGAQQGSLISNVSLSISDDSTAVSLQDIDTSSERAAPLIKKLSSVRPKSSRRLTDIQYIGPGKLITEDEAVKLIEVFFLTMHPFFPHIPLQLHDPRELVRYPLLLCAIITISARYHAFHEIGLKDDDSHRRHIKVHEQLWVNCQKLISKTIWAEASTRSIGTVLAFLLFTEWNPRAIHWNWPDYANQGDDAQNSRMEVSEWSNTEGDGGLSGMAAIRRSDRMNWMLTGTAVRLAQDMGLLEISGKIFTAAHIAETYTAMNVGQRSTLSESLSEINFDALEADRSTESAERIGGNEKFYLEQILQDDESKGRWTGFLHDIKESSSNCGAGPLSDVELEFLNDEYVLYYAASDDSRPRNSPDTLPYPLRFTQVQRAKIELLRIISIGYESIYSGKDRQQLLLNDPRRNLALLQIISPLIESWGKTYQALQKPAEGSLDDSGSNPSHSRRQSLSLVQTIDGESLICEYNYCQLYVYSLALQVDVRESQLKPNDITRCAKYVELAYNAAKKLLASATRLQRLQLLKCVPVRWIVRIVRSVAFIVKCYLTLMGNTALNDPLTSTILKLTVISPEELLQTIQTAAIILREASPDELHLCTRYSTILMYLCSEMHNKEPQPPRPARETSRPQHTPQDTTTAFLNDCPNSHRTPSLPAEVLDWFTTSDEIGLDFVESWTEMIEQRYLQNSEDVKEQLLDSFYDQLSSSSLHSPHKH
ncbi:hypothetical protein HG536_0A05440 [Torulaspora globosa]|uniref:Zn(2)-C6 fungal-type domain-containing protein n=1 Tax=Torulaspora globosa TaxID=48254 RepID=A0A7G3ZB43_9SACH|nr:uncharacterized protein HG536_0A05440 [Torulaspora globosa]QLL30729.1 hypothetical protein HG536_0A05440 [Torulaspora globosa]